MKAGLLLAILSFGSVVRADGSESPLIAAAATGDVIRLKALLAQGADANVKDKDGATPLHWAAATGHKEIVEVLLPKDRSEWPPEVLLTGKTSFPAAVDGKQVETAELPVGTKLRVIGVQGEQIKVAFQG